MKRCSTSLIIWLTHSVVFDSLRPRGLQHARLPCPAPIPSTCSNSRSSSWWYHPTISSSVVPFSSASFLRTQFFVSGSHSGGASASASASALPMSIQDLLPLGLIDWISLQCKDSQWEFSSTTVQKHQFFCAQLLLHFFFFNFILFLNFIILYRFWNIWKWICHRHTRGPHPEPSSLLPPHTIPLGRPSAPAPSIQYHASNLDWQLVSYMIFYMFQCHSPKSSHPFPLPQSPIGG